MSYPSIDIVILNWNGLEDTKACLKSLLKVDYPNYRVLLVDNGSRNNETEKLKAAFPKEKHIVYIQNAENLGFAGGCNVAIGVALTEHSDYVLLLNNDTEVASDFLSQLVSLAETDKEIGVVGAKIFLHDQPEKIWTAATYFNHYFPPFSKMIEPEQPVEVNSVVGCCMLVKTSVIEQVGAFDEEYFAYGEEDDLNLRILRAGYKLMYCPTAKVWHKVGRSTGGGFNPTMAYLKMRNKIKFAKKNYSFKYWPSYGLFLMLYFCKCQVRALLGRNFKTSLALLRGVRDGL